MSTWKPSQELIDLLTEVVEGRISPADHARFEELLTGDAAAQAYAVDYLSLHAQLTWNVEDVLPQTLVTPEDILTEDLSRARPRPGDSTSSLLKVAYWKQHRVRFGALALALTLLFWAGVGWVIFSRFRGEGDSSPIPAHVATLTSTRGAAWAEGARSYEAGDYLPAGDTLELAAGYAEVTFQHGAVVVLEAPAEFTVNTRAAGTLAHGRLVARIVPQNERPQGIPFAISTPRAQLIDMGTEFGVEAARGGSVSVEVFSGKVEATPLTRESRGKPPSLTLVSGQVARLEADGREFQLREGAGEPLEFVQAIPPADAPPRPRVIVPVAVLPAGMENGIHSTTRLIDGSGFQTFGPLEERLHESAVIDQGLEQASNYWAAGYSQSDSVALTFDLGDRYEVSRMYLWNFDNVGIASARCVKRFRCEVSLDGETFESLGEFELELLHRPSPPAIFSLDCPARYVRLEILENFGDVEVCLGEIRFEGFPVGDFSEQEETSLP